MFFSYKVDNEITLKEPTESYAAEFSKGVVEDYEYLSEFCSFPTVTRTETEANKLLAEYREVNKTLNGLHSLIIVENKLAGAFHLNRFDFFNSTTDFGYWLFSKYQGRGIITRCCEAMLEYSFNELRFNRIEIKCAADNLKSQIIPNKLGFQKEGVLRQNEWVNQRFSDSILFSMLREDWTKKIK